MTESERERSNGFHDIPWLIATGQGRSGTTVLTRALAAHPNVCSNRVESNVMKDVLLAGRGSTTVQSRIRQMVLPRDEHDRVFRTMLTDLLFPTRLWENTEPPQRLSTFSAMSAEAAAFAVEALPGIHFANIVRNGVEVVASRMVHRVMKEHSFSEQCDAWAAAIEMARWGEGRSDFSLLRHEDLLQPERCRAAFASLQQSIELPLSDAPADFVLREKRNQTQAAGENDDASQDLSRRAERCLQWSAEQKREFEQRCGDAMDYFGYVIPW